MYRSRFRIIARWLRARDARKRYKSYVYAFTPYPISLYFSNQKYRYRNRFNEEEK